MIKTATSKDTLYGNIISKNQKGKLGEQLYYTFLREINCGRWAVGERLPSYQELAKKSGLSRSPIEAALTRLEEKGYIEKIKKKGIFLKSMHPGKHINLGTIAVITSNELHRSLYGESLRTHSFGMWEIETLKIEAEMIGLNLSFISLREDINADKKEFKIIAGKPDFIGVISMVSDEILEGLYDINKIKTVYLGLEDTVCSPCITGNPARAMHMLTEHLISLGHKKIAVFASAEKDPEVMQTVLRGHKRALRNAGLTYNEQAVEQSSAIQYLDASSMKKFIEANSDATAFIGTTVDASIKFVETCDLLDISIPEDISLCSMQGTRMRQVGSKNVVGINYNWHKIIVTCFESLLDAEKFSQISRIVFDPQLFPGQSTRNIK